MIRRRIKSQIVGKQTIIQKTTGRKQIKYDNVDNKDHTMIVISLVVIMSLVIGGLYLIKHYL